MTNFPKVECLQTSHAKLGSEPSFVMQKQHLYYVYGKKFTVDTRASVLRAGSAARIF